MTATFLAAALAVMTATVADAQTRTVGWEVCVAIDEAHDTFTPQDRTAARLLLMKQFELAGQRVVDEGCPTSYALSHVVLGSRIMVTLSGPNGEREGSALGLDDLPALYNQMVRSIVTGRPMTGFNVVDRSNVTAAQATTHRVQSDSFGYARIGYGSIFGDKSYGGPSVGFGYRVELDSFGIDVSFLNFQSRPADTAYNYNYASYDEGAFAGSLVKLEGLYFKDPTANATAYFGGGVSWGGTTFGSGWSGSGLQGELTVGYEFPRASTMRLFIQADAGLPFYTVTAPMFSSKTGYVTGTEHRYAPSLIVSLGLGWQRDRRAR